MSSTSSNTPPLPADVAEFLSKRRNANAEPREQSGTPEAWSRTSTPEVRGASAADNPVQGSRNSPSLVSSCVSICSSSQADQLLSPSPGPDNTQEASSQRGPSPVLLSVEVPSRPPSVSPAVNREEDVERARSAPTRGPGTMVCVLVPRRPAEPGRPLSAPPKTNEATAATAVPDGGSSSRHQSAPSTLGEEARRQSGPRRSKRLAASSPDNSGRELHALIGKTSPPPDEEPDGDNEDDPEDDPDWDEGSSRRSQTAATPSDATSDSSGSGSPAYTREAVPSHQEQVQAVKKRLVESRPKKRAPPVRWSETELGYLEAQIENEFEDFEAILHSNRDQRDPPILLKRTVGDYRRKARHIYLSKLKYAFLFYPSSPL